MLNQNIVCFGPTNTGKSTLAGYLCSHDMSHDEYEKKVQQFRTKYGKYFQERRILSYFVDTGKDEYRPQRNTLGTSKRKHFTVAHLEEELNCTLIDSPGTDKRWRNGFQGIYMGDIGIFVIEIDLLIDLYANHIKGSYEYEQILERLLVPVSLWDKYGRIDQLIIVISKMDLCDYSRYILARAEKVLKEQTLLKNVPIIPISINVKKRSDENVFSESNNFPGHQCLLSAIKDILGKKSPVHAEPNTSRLLAAIDKRFDKTKLTGEPALRVKVIDGDITIGRSLKIGPVKYKGRINDVTGTVRTLMSEAEHQKVDTLAKNHIGGIVFSRLQNGRDLFDLKEMELFNTSMIMNIDSTYSSGNFLVFSIKKDGIVKDLFENCSLNEDIKLIWFGKNEILRIISCADKATHYRIGLMNTKHDNYPFYFQHDEKGEVAYSDYVVQYKNKFLQARLQSAATISDDNRKDVVVYLKKDYRGKTGITGMDEAYYIEKNNATILMLRNLSGIELTNALFNEGINKNDILEVAIKNN